ncbi:hypothetical protein A4X13_0g761 [Tilletia indica]|uniref:Uncharacterized protein n=1 Tax=Tilletia indica TaxID=43049 RepID=A0A8T8TE48_9BASI|nr:hypothetical protein A4X13_0g761 [Tilletia indica]
MINFFCHAQWLDSTVPEDAVRSSPKQRRPVSWPHTARRTGVVARSLRYAGLPSSWRAKSKSPRAPTKVARTPTRTSITPIPPGRPTRTMSTFRASPNDPSRRKTTSATTTANGTKGKRKAEDPAGHNDINKRRNA